MKSARSHGRLKPDSGVPKGFECIARSLPDNFGGWQPRMGIAPSWAIALAVQSDILPGFAPWPA